MYRLMSKKFFTVMTFGVALMVAFTTFGTMPFSSVRTARAADACKADNAVWVGTFGFGVNCLDDAGFKSYVQGESELQSNQIGDIAACADGSTWISNTLGLLKVTADKMEPIESDAISPEGIACDGKGGAWVAHYQGISHYSDGKWTTTEAKKLGTGSNVDLVKDVAVAPDGTIWVVTSNSVASSKDGAEWTIYENSKGFDKEYYLENVAIDSKGTVYVTQSSGLLVFDGKEWKAEENDKLFQTQALAIDSKDVVWVGTYSDGLSSFDGKSWTTYDRKNSKLSSDQVRVLAVDGQDRVWAGTEYGLNVFDGKEFTIYRMDNSALLDNNIYALAIVGKGPVLPAAADKAKGTLTGTIVNGKDPVAGTTVELCTEFIGGTFSGDTPCADNPFSMQTKTDDKGVFEFKDAPVGRYGIVVKGTDGWIRITNEYGGDSKEEVKEGDTKDIGSLDISNVKK